MTALRQVFLPAVASGVLLWAAFFPLDLGPLALVALAPFLLLVRAPAVSNRRRYLAAFAGGGVFYGLAINWVRVAHPAMMFFTWPAGTIYCALYWPLALYLLRKLDPVGLPFTVTLPAVWVGLEYVRAHFPTGFSWLEPLGLFQPVGFNWYALGYALHGQLVLIQAADLGGVYLISAMVACVNGAAYEWVVRSPAVRKLTRWPASTATRRTFVWEAYRTAWAAIFPVLVVCYGTVQLAHPAYAPGPRVAAVQGNVPQNEKVQRGDQAPADGVSPLEREYFPLAAQAARPRPPEPAPDLVVWPETCFPVDWDEVAPELTDADAAAAKVRRAADYYRRLFTGDKLARLPAAHYLLGLNRLEWAALAAPARRYNSAVLFDPDRRPLGSYDKMHLVPFGEYVPFQSGFLKQFTPYTHDYSCTPGAAFTTFTVPAAGLKGQEFKFGVLICYEDTDPDFARRYNKAGGRADADFLVNISNDGWFAGTEEHAQHLAICQVRAVEARRSVVRAVNTGISAVIDPDGRVIALPDPTSWAKSAQVSTVVRAEVPIATQGTLFALLGDWVPLACWLGVAAGLVWRRLSGRRPA